MLLLLINACLGVNVAQAQQSSYLRGFVMNPLMKPIPNVLVKFDGGQIETSSSGEFYQALTDIPAGRNINIQFVKVGWELLDGSMHHFTTVHPSETAFRYVILVPENLAKTTKAQTRKHYREFKAKTDSVLREIARNRRVLSLIQQKQQKLQLVLGDHFSDLKFWLLSQKKQYTPEEIKQMGQTYIQHPFTEQKGWKMLLQSAQKGDAQAQWKLGNRYAQEPRYQKYGTNWLLKSARQGFVKAMADLGVMYFQQQNFTQAYHWFKMAANQGNAYAQNGLGMLYLHIDRYKNKRKAFKWFKASAEQGNASGLNNLGHMYLRGIGVKKNHAKATELIKQAARKGDKSAQGWFQIQGISFD